MSHDPLRAFAEDLQRARDAGDPAASFVALTTVGLDGRPAARMVTVRRVEADALVVSAHASGAKVADLRERPGFCALAWWSSLQRQVRLSGVEAEHVPAAALPELYAGTPLRARAWDWLYEALPQGTPVDDRAAFAAPFERLAAELEAAPREPAPGAGYLRLRPDQVEVQTLDLERRLHDRRRYVRAEGAWTGTLLTP